MSYDNDELMWEEGNSYFNDDNELDILVEKEEEKKKNKPKYKMSDFDWGDGAENQTSQSPQFSEDVIKVKAYLDNIVFPKYPKVLGEDDDTWGVTNWCILETLEGSPELNNRGLLVVTGDFFGPLDYGKPYTIVGKANETKYGMQYKLIYYNQEFDLTKVNNQKAFLSTILTEQQIKDIFDTLDNPLQSIADHDVEALMKVHNIGPVYAQKIIERYEDNKDMSAVYMELDGYGVTPNIIGKLRNYYKSPSKIIEMVKYHPYQLTFDIDGIGFLTADKIALAGGLHPKDPDRIGAWIKWFMEEEGNKGHSYITASELTSNLFYYFEGRENIEETYYDDNGNVIGNNILEAMENLKDNNIICLEEREDGNKTRRRVYLKRYWELEKNIASELSRLINAKNLLNYIGWEDKIKQIEEEQGFEFTEEQIAGIKKGLENNVCYITGGAGCGKSSLVAGILAVLDKYSFAQCALSGRAAARLTEVTGQEGMTIHRLLRYTGGGFEYNEKNKLPYNIIILDELSLVGGEIYLSLLKAIETGSHVYFLGDRGQLEAIGALNLAEDLYTSDKIPTAELTKIHRQAAKSGIITTAQSVRNQEQLFDNDYEGVEVLGELQDMELDIQEEKDEVYQRTLNYFEKFFDSPWVNKNILNIQLLSPVRKRGDSCVFNLNLGVQSLYNPVDENSTTPKIKVSLDKENYFYIQKGDKVMNVKNNYRTLSIDGVLSPIFNGWMGIVEDIDDNYVYVNFPLGHGITMIEKKEAKNQLTLGYASTVHKCVAGDTWIYTNYGPLQIKDVDSSLIGTLKVFNGEELESPDEFYINPEQECLTFLTKRGFEITTSLDHKMFTLNEQLELVAKEARDFKVGDWFIQEKGEHIFPSFEEDLPIDWFIGLDKQDERVILYDIPTKMTKSFAEFLGFMVADGVVQKNKFALGKKELDYVERFADLVFELFGYKVEIYKVKQCNMWKAEINSVYIASFLQKIDGLQPFNKNVPDCILKSTEEIQCAFLRAFVEDGNINLKGEKFDHIEMTSNVPELIDKISLMLLNLGIGHSLKYKSLQVTKNDITKEFKYKSIYIYKKDAIVFDQKIGFVSNLNKGKIKSAYYDNSSNRRSQEKIPISKTFLQGLKQKYSDWWKNLDNEIKLGYNAIIAREVITQDKLEKIVNTFTSEMNQDKSLLILKDLFKKYTVYQIEKISSTIEPTYCFNMPFSHKFIANGFLSSNCQGEGIPVVIGAVDYSTPPQMLTHQLIYTLVTRAKNYCVLVAQNGALRKAIATDFVSSKRTFLPEFLEEI